jgi:predicted metal-dependent TIM-barrel fold hydrolase
VAYALKSGAKVAWMPTVDAKYAYEKSLAGHWIGHVNKRNAFASENPQYTLIDDAGQCIKEVSIILRMAREADAIVASGHISPQECLALLKENQSIGAKVVITHPNLWFDDFTVERLLEMVKMGAFVEFTSGGLSPNRGHGDLYEMVEAIRAVGCEHSILSTDGGNIASPSPPQDLRSFCYLLRGAGIPERDIEQMVRDNPTALLGL